MLCRDVCHYCTFARPPRRGERAYLTVDEALAIAREGAEAGCREALFTLGDKPELRYRAARDELARTRVPDDRRLPRARRGSGAARDRAAAAREPRACSTTTSSLALREVCPSQGIMLETTSDRLSAARRPPLRLARQGSRRPHRRDRTGRAAAHPVHQRHPDRHRRDPARARRGADRAARPAPRARAPAGGDRPELPREARHEDGGRGRADARRPPLDDRRRAPRCCRPTSRCRRRPNLSGDDFPALLAAGIDDFGGVSPVTPDHVNPEAPWPDVARLEAACAAAGRTLLPRLAVYPRFLADPETWLSDGTRGPSLAASDGLGLARRERWTTGTVPEPPPAWRGGRRPQPVGGVSPAFERALERAEARSAARRGRRDGPAVGPRARGRAARRRRRPPARRARRRPRHLRRLPERQLHERLLLPLRLLRLLQGQARREPARPRLPPERRRGRPPRRRGLVSAAPPRSACRAGSTPASPGAGTSSCCTPSRRPCRRSTCTRSRRSRSGRAPRRPSGTWRTT